MSNFFPASGAKLHEQFMSKAKDATPNPLFPSPPSLQTTMASSTMSGFGVDTNANMYSTGMSGAPKSPMELDIGFRHAMALQQYS